MNLTLKLVLIVDRIGIGVLTFHGGTILTRLVHDNFKLTGTSRVFQPFLPHNSMRVANNSFAGNSRSLEMNK